MRIISGELRGLRLNHDKNDKGCRPTQDRVKESIFNSLYHQIEPTLVLDCCCGTGSLGLEALSRGAEHVYFTDKNCDIVKQNIQKLPPNFEEKTSVYRHSLPRFLKHFKHSVDLMFLDPPYDDTALYQFALKHISDSDILKDTGLVVCEHSRKIPHLDLYNLSLKSTHSYGSTLISVLKK